MDESETTENAGMQDVFDLLQKVNRDNQALAAQIETLRDILWAGAILLGILFLLSGGRR